MTPLWQMRPPASLTSLIEPVAMALIPPVSPRQLAAIATGVLLLFMIATLVWACRQPAPGQQVGWGAAQTVVSVLAACMTVTLGAAVQFAPASWPAPRPTWDGLRDGDVVPTCWTASGQASIDPSKQALVVGVRAKSVNDNGEDDRWSLDAEVSYDPDTSHWKSHVSLQPTLANLGPSFELVLLVLPRATRDYLVSTNPHAESAVRLTYWTSPGLPPDVLSKRSVIVIRNFKAQNSCG